MITCKSGNTVYFSIDMEDLLYAEQVTPDTILLNFFDRTGLVEVRVRSENCLSIIKELTA